ncbi:hypothetical protein CBR_g3049 [Chara braunii]|uniref:Uncharacterized protein n=1 Tax=Chara braunii TaxID=69332 RepID=A0A388KEL4_CHABU|nr:hypothetical protein CBR_g3049 [Chara braunii]|eukprot:GBG68505.1 hypothetical protein CBR_g3049 [Chara braunii]
MQSSTAKHRQNERGVRWARFRSEGRERRRDCDVLCIGAAGQEAVAVKTTVGGITVRGIAVLKTAAVETAAAETGAAETGALETAAVDTAAVDTAAVETATVDNAGAETPAVETAGVETAAVEAADESIVGAKKKLDDTRTIATCVGTTERDVSHVETETKQLAAVLHHPSFKQDPFAAIHQHLQNTLPPPPTADTKPSKKSSKKKGTKKKHGGGNLGMDTN